VCAVVNQIERLSTLEVLSQEEKLSGQEGGLAPALTLESTPPGLMAQAFTFRAFRGGAVEF